jgi:hypothetical protein
VRALPPDFADSINDFITDFAPTKTEAHHSPTLKTRPAGNDPARGAQSARLWNSLRGGQKKVKTAWATLIVAVLVFCGGCVPRPDWIEATLVTADVTGVWQGTIPMFVGADRGNPDMRAVFDLEQEGPKVKGTLETPVRRLSGPLEGRVGGDVFHFKVINNWGEISTGEVTVSGDEMVGDVTLPAWGAGLRSVRLLLRRVEAPSRPVRQSP